MKQKIKTQQGFIKIPLLIAIIVSSLVISAGAYGGFEYYKTSKVIKEAEQLTGQEQYQEATEKLMVAQVSWFSKDLGVKREEIKDKIERNEILFSEKSKIDKALGKFDEGNWQESINLLAEIPDSSPYYQKATIKTEEAKRKIVEGELAGEKIARKEAEEKAEEEAVKRAQEEVARKAAEEKAKQEKEERKVKEKELAEKEAEEDKMNTDNDRDGLTYREELKLGTSDLNSDSDGDGILDNLDTHPAGGGRNISQTFVWNHGDYDWTLTESIQEDWYDYYKAKPRSSPESVEYITGDDPFIKKISKALTKRANSDIPKTWVAVAFVQSLPYVDDVYTGYDEYPKYPIETFFEKNGDCEDTSYLAASIINAMNIGSALVLLPGHMAIAVWMDCDESGIYYKLDDKCYYYVETTGKNWPGGEIPDEYRNTRATLIKIPSGKTANVYPQYTKPCYASPDFSGYYYDGSNYYSDSQCNYQANCLPWSSYISDPSLSGYYYNPQLEKTYHDSSCTQILVKGCYKSKSYSGYFYKSGSAWYYDSQCTQLYQSMACDYPSSYAYSCVYESSYNLKKSTCDYYQSSSYLSDLADSCYEKLAQCRADIDEYQKKLDEYNQCKDRKEY